MKPRGRSLLRLVVLVMLCAAGGSDLAGAQSAAAGIAAVPIEPITGILEMFKTHDVVALSEGNHGNEQGHAFRLALIRDPRFAAAVNDIVVEFGNAHYQAVIDRFVQGEPVAYEELRKVWQDTTQRGTVWDRPIYEEFYRAVRDVNAALPVERRLRVLLGDVPMDWYASPRSSPPRTDDFPASVIQREVLAKKRRALVIYGGMHLIRKRPTYLPPKDPALAPVVATFLRDFQNGSIVTQLDQVGARVSVVATSTDFDIATIQANVVEWRKPSLTLIRGTPLGLASSLTYFPRSLPVIRGRGGIQETLQPDLAAVPPMQEVVDGILYLGPPSSITQSRLSRKLCADPVYIKMREERLTEFSSLGAAAFKAECAAPLGPQVMVPVSVPQPVYPPIANAARVSGDVVIKVGVRPDGTVASAAVESGVPLLQDVALKAAQQAQFECRDCVEPATPYSLVFAFRFAGQDKSDLPAGLTTTPDGHATVIVLGKVGYWFEGAVFSTIGVRVRAAKCLWLWRCGVNPVSR